MKYFQDLRTPPLPSPQLRGGRLHGDVPPSPELRGGKGGVCVSPDFVIRKELYWWGRAVNNALLPFDSAQSDGHGERSRTWLPHHLQLQYAITNNFLLLPTYFVNRKKFSSFLLTLPTPFDEYLFTERTARTSRQREVSPPFFSDNRHRERNMSC